MLITKFSLVIPTNTIQLFPGREKGYWPQLGDAIISHTTILQPVRLHYTIRVDKEFHENPQPTIYDVQVTVEDPLKAALEASTRNPAYAANLLEIATLDKQLAVMVQAIANSKSKHSFFDALSKNPTEFIRKWISSQKRDLEIIAGDGMRGGGEDATSDEWRKGGADGVWGSTNVKELAALMISTGKVRTTVQNLEAGSLEGDRLVRYGIKIEDQCSFMISRLFGGSQELIQWNGWNDLFPRLCVIIIVWINRGFLEIGDETRDEIKTKNEYQQNDTFETLTYHLLLTFWCSKEIRSCSAIREHWVN